MNHITFDLETLGTGPKSPIVQIAAVSFSAETGDVIAEFNSRIDLGKDFWNFEADVRTIEFWIAQSPKAKQLVFDPKGRDALNFALSNLNTWLLQFSGKSKFWSHATFDPPILMNAFKVCGLEPKIQYRDFMDIRTLNFLAGDVTSRPRETFGEHHDAIADCKYQADYIAAMLRKVGKL